MNNDRETKKKIIMLALLGVGGFGVPIVAQSNILAERVFAKEAEPSVLAFTLKQNSINLNVGDSLPDWSNYINDVLDEQGNIISFDNVLIDTQQIDANSDNIVDDIATGTYDVVYSMQEGTNTVEPVTLKVNITNSSPVIKLAKEEEQVENSSSAIGWRDYIIEVEDDGSSISSSEVTIESNIDTDLDGIIDEGKTEGDVTYTVYDSVGNKGVNTLHIEVVSPTVFEEPSIVLSDKIISVKSGDKIDWNSYVTKVVSMSGQDITKSSNILVDDSLIDLNNDDIIDDSVNGPKIVVFEVEDPEHGVVGKTPLVVNILDDNDKEAPTLTLNTSQIEVEKGSKIEDNTWKSYIQNVEDNVDALNIESVNIDSSKIDTNADGVVDALVSDTPYEVTYSVVDNAGNKTEVKLNVLVKDKIEDKNAPILKLSEDEIQLSKGTQVNADFWYSYIESVLDEGTISTGNVSVDDSEINLVNSGTVDAPARLLPYTVIYNVADSNGNVTSSALQVKVVNQTVSDVEGSFNLKEEEIQVHEGDSFSLDKWYDYVEVIDGTNINSIDLNVSEVDANSDGIIDANSQVEPYEVTYSLETKTRQTVVKTLKVRVLDSNAIGMAPSISLNENSILVGQNSKMSTNDWKGYVSEVVDAEDDNLTVDNIVINSSQVDTNNDGTIDVNPGNYEISYKVIDSNDNVGEEKLNVKVGKEQDGILFFKGVKASEAKAKSGETLHYEYIIKNDSFFQGTLEDLVLVDVLDDNNLNNETISNLSITKANGEDITAEITGSILTGINLGDLEIGDEVIIQFDINAVDIFDNASEINSNAKVTAANYKKWFFKFNQKFIEESQTDIELVQPLVAADGINFSKQVTGGTGVDGKVLPEDTLTYTYTIENQSFSPGTLEGVKLVDSLNDDDLDISTLSSLQVKDTDGTDITSTVTGDITSGLELGNIASGFKVEVTFNIQAVSAFDESAEIDSQATVTATNYKNLLGKEKVIAENEIDIQKDLTPVVDEAPEITLITDKIEVEEGQNVAESEWLSYVASVSDDHDEVTISDVELDLSEVDGTDGSGADGIIDAPARIRPYIVTYKVTDTVGHTSEVQLKVKVVEAQEADRAPEITLTTDKIEVEEGQNVAESEWLSYVASVSDDHDEVTISDVELDLSEVDGTDGSGADGIIDAPARIRPYIVTYKVTDTIGHTSEVQLKVKVVEAQEADRAPEITLTTDKIEVEEGQNVAESEWLSYVASVSDDHDEVTISDVELDLSEVDGTDGSGADGIIDAPARIRPYIVTYKVTDTVGHTSEAQLKVKVVEAQEADRAPEITLTTDKIEVEEGQNVAESEWLSYVASVSDDHDEVTISDVELDLSEVDGTDGSGADGIIDAPARIRPYIVTYKVTDTVGHTSEVQLKVKVVEAQEADRAPEITLTTDKIEVEEGQNVAESEWLSYVASVSDDHDEVTISDVELDLSEVDGTDGSGADGIIDAPARIRPYIVTYKVTDTVGHTSEVQLKVKVVEAQEADRAPEITLTTDKIEVEEGQNVAESEWLSYVASVSDDHDEVTISDVELDLSEVDGTDGSGADGIIDAPARIRPYKVTYKVTDTVGHTSEVQLKVKVVEAQEADRAPEITLTTDKIEVEEGQNVAESEWLSYVASVSDDHDEVTISDVELDLSEVDGTDGSGADGIIDAPARIRPYKVTYKVTDTVGHTSEAQLKVKVVEAQEADRAPEITLTTDKIEVEEGQNVAKSEWLSYVASVSDDHDEVTISDVELDLSEVDGTDGSGADGIIDAPARIRPYKVTYKVTDTVGHTSEAQLKVKVVEEQEVEEGAPIITLTEESVSIPTGTTMTNSDWISYVQSVEDDKDVLTVKDIVVNDLEVDTNDDDVIDVAAGTYEVEYTVVDTEGKEGSATLSVTVTGEEVEEGAPIITLTEESVSIPTGTTMTNSDWISYVQSVEDDKDVLTVKDIVVNDLEVDTNDDDVIDVAAGTYEVEYTVVDTEGKEGSATLSVTVTGEEVEEGAPIITLTEESVSIPTGTTMTNSDWISYVQSVEDDKDVLTVKDIVVNDLEVDTNDDDVIDVAAGTYEVEYTVVDTEGKEGSATLSVTVIEEEITNGIIFTKEVTGGTGILDENGKATAKKGDLLHYKYVIKNDSFEAGELQGVVLNDPLDDTDMYNTTIANLSVTDEEGTDILTTSGNVLSGLSLGNIAVGSSRIIELDARASQVYDDSEYIDSQAYITADNLQRKLLKIDTKISENNIDIFKELGDPVLELSNYDITLVEGTENLDAIVRGYISKVEDDVDVLTVDDVVIDLSTIDTDLDDTLDVSAGEYIITYTVTDSEGKTTSKQMKIHVVPTDYENIAPTIYLSESAIKLEKGDAAPDWQTYILGVSDDTDDLVINDVTIDSSEVNMNEEGEYHVYYTVYDTLGAKGEATLTVSVSTDIEAPVIELYDNKDDFIIGSEEPNWSDYIKSVSDNTDTLTKDDVVIDTSKVDMTTVGIFVVNYSVTDSSGNTGEANLLIHISKTGENTGAPVIDLYASSVSYYIGSDMPNWLIFVRGVSDDKDDLDKSDLVIDSSSVDMNTLGTYSVVYSLTDSDNNTTTETMEVKIVPQSTDGDGDVLSDTSKRSINPIYLLGFMNLIIVVVDKKISKK